MASDSSSSGWGVTTVSPDRREPLGYWTQEELTWDIVTKYCYRARMKFLPPRVDVQVDNQAVILAWNNQGGRSCQLNNALKVLFSTTVTVNVVLYLLYVRSADNLAHGPSRHRSSKDFCLTDRF